MPPSVGVVIPCYNNARNLEWILEALAPQLTGADEVIAVDDHSDEPLALPRRPRKVRLLRSRRPGGPGNRSAARNEGWRACDARLIVFLDGDMVPGPHFLAALRRLHQENPGVVVKAARLSLTAEEQARGKAPCLRDVATGERWLGRPADPVRAKRLPCARTAKWYFAASNALSVERRHVERVGGWDEGYHGWGEEDMDFAYRLHRAGLGFAFPGPRLLYAVHLDHDRPTDWAASLERNARRFVAKFAEVFATRLPAYRACGLSLGRGPTDGPPKQFPPSHADLYNGDEATDAGGVVPRR
jgi:GT2 family glycosyltransferase